MKKLSPISNKITKKTLAFAVMFVLMFSYVSPNAFAEDVISSTPCVTTDTLGDTHVEDVGTSPEPTFASIVSDYGISIGSQTQYQIWHTNKATTTFEITFLNGYTAAGDVFGYYKKGNINSFVPLFKNGSTNSVYPAVTQANPGQVYTVTLPAGDYGFAMHMEFGGHAYRTSETSLNENGEDNIISYNVSNSPQTYILGLEDLPFSVSDRDYNDIVVKIKTVSCENPNHAPVITLVGANPATVIVGNTYTDPGATALDQEDGDITPNIVATSTVNTSVVGSYTVTYNVKDSQGLAATPISRTVNVVSAPLTSSNIFATKIVCDSETDLPNWGDKSGPDIASTTAIDFLSTHPNCHLQKDWKFQWAVNAENPGDNVIGEVGSPWTTFGPTNVDGVTMTSIPATTSMVWFREVMEEGYFKFTGQNTDKNVSAEMYCNTDHLNYDNYDFISNPEAGKTYYCVAFNVINHAPVITLVGANPATVIVGNTYTDPGATALDQEDGDITPNIVATSTVNTSVVGSYTVTYNVKDSQGLAATEVTRVVDVVPQDTVKIVATKIVCDSETDLPNWGDKSGPDIASTTATNFLLNHPNCRLQAGWDFEWAPNGTANPGDNITTPAGGSWTTFPDSTNASGTTEVSVPVDSLIWVREIMREGYVGFTGQNTTENISAEIYCNADHLNYDNYDFITPVIAGQTYYCVAFNALKEVPVNHAPVITLVGANPATVIVGNTYTDPGATALDQEDGDITPNIVATSTVNTSVVGSYTVTYNVKDSQGLAATPVSRTVNVLENGGGGATTGSITFCLALADKDNVIATSSLSLPAGSFILNLATSTDISSTTIQSKNWTNTAFAPNSKLISGTVNDADCVKYSDLKFGTYYYSELGITGSLWNIAKYSDKYNQPINNVFDFFNYSPELFNATTTDDSSRNMNSDGQITLTVDNRDQSANLYVTYNPAPCTDCGGGGSPVSNLSVTKTVDKTTAGVGDTLTYIVTVTNNGPYNATGVSLAETLPSLLDLVSATSTYGTYSTTTNIWTIGDLPVGHSTTTLTLVGTVKAGAEGQKVTNTVNVTGNQSDNDTSNNTFSVDTNINPAPVPPCTVNCGGGGGNGPIVGSYGGSNGPIVPQVAGASTTSCYYLYDYLRKDFNNNPVEVKKLQVFLRDLEGFSTVDITGVYDDQTIVALNAFQWRYKDDILTPWGHTAPTSYTYILTKKKVNEIYCKTAFPVTTQQQEEIDNYRNFLESLRKEGINIGGGVSVDTINTGAGGSFEDPVTSVNTSSSNSGSASTGLTTLAGISSTTEKIAGDMTANVISAGKRFANTALAFLAWPFGSSFKNLFNRSSECVLGIGIFGWINLFLLIVIIIISYLWYREYKNNKKIEDINKEIDLN